MHYMHFISLNSYSFTTPAGQMMLPRARVVDELYSFSITTRKYDFVIIRIISLADKLHYGLPKRIRLKSRLVSGKLAAISVFPKE